jgi:hypothetical protein
MIHVFNRTTKALHCANQYRLFIFIADVYHKIFRFVIGCCRSWKALYDPVFLNFFVDRRLLFESLLRIIFSYAKRNDFPYSARIILVRKRDSHPAQHQSVYTSSNIYFYIDARTTRQCIVFYPILSGCVAVEKEGMLIRRQVKRKYIPMVVPERVAFIQQQIPAHSFILL